MNCSKVESLSWQIISIQWFSYCSYWVDSTVVIMKVSLFCSRFIGRSLVKGVGPIDCTIESLGHSFCSCLMVLVNLTSLVDLQDMWAVLPMEFISDKWYLNENVTWKEMRPNLTSAYIRFVFENLLLNPETAPT